jgi:PAS domain S-box-containing protein
MSNRPLPVRAEEGRTRTQGDLRQCDGRHFVYAQPRLIQANALCAEMFGYTLGEFIDQPALILYSDQEAYSALGREAGPVLAAGRAFRTETQLKRKDGNLLWCRVSAKAVDPEHPSDGTLWIIEDISEDRLMIEALERSTRELSAILDTASVGIGVVRNRVFVRCNRRFEEIFGLPEGTLVGQSSRWLFNSDEEFQRVGEQVYTEFAAGVVHRREQSYLRRDGRTVWVRVSGGAFDTTNPHAGSVWLTEDFTATHEAEQRARQAFEEQQIIFDNAAVGILFARDRMVQRCNRRLAEIFGYEADELAGRSTRVFFLNARRTTSITAPRCCAWWRPAEPTSARHGYGIVTAMPSGCVRRAGASQARPRAST